jgi:hypothetical protein
MENNVFVLMQKRAVATNANNSQVCVSLSFTAFISGTLKKNPSTVEFFYDEMSRNGSKRPSH